MARVTVTFNVVIDHRGDLHNSSFGTARPSLGGRLSESENEIFIAAITIRDSGRVELNLVTTISGAGDNIDFSDQMESSGTITLVAGTNSVVITGIGDATEPYTWTPSNASAIAAFLDLQTQNVGFLLSVTFNDNATNLFERVNGIYVPVELFERVNGSYVSTELHERVGGVYTQ